jgi:hypothetical protein
METWATSATQSTGTVSVKSAGVTNDGESKYILVRMWTCPGADGKLIPLPGVECS